MVDGSADLDWEGIDIGRCIQGEVQDIKEYGVIINIQGHKDVVGFVTHHQCKLINFSNFMCRELYLCTISSVFHT
jgi:hypothetical protein